MDGRRAADMRDSELGAGRVRVAGCDLRRHGFSLHALTVERPHE